MLRCVQDAFRTGTSKTANPREGPKEKYLFSRYGLDCAVSSLTGSLHAHGVDLIELVHRHILIKLRAEREYVHLSGWEDGSHSHQSQAYGQGHAGPFASVNAEKHQWSEERNRTQKRSDQAEIYNGDAKHEYHGNRCFGGN